MKQTWNSQKDKYDKNLQRNEGFIETKKAWQEAKLRKQTWNSQTDTNDKD